MGFTGRRGIFEALEINKELTDALQGSDPHTIDKLARAQIGQRTLAHGAANMVLNGTTSVAEAMTIAE